MIRKVLNQLDCEKRVTNLKSINIYYSIIKKKTIYKKELSKLGIDTLSTKYYNLVFIIY